MTAPILDAADSAAIARAADILRDGGLVAMPTETVYGLAADASNAKAVARLYEAKGRPRFNPLISHVPDLEAARRHGEVSPLAEKLAGAFWPGPLTLVLPVRAGSLVCDLARAGLETIALRAPAHPAAQALLRAFGGPLVAPSANPSEGLSPTRAKHVAEGLGEKIDLILDGGPCAVGVESSVVAVKGDIATLLRPGGLSRVELEAVAGTLETARPGDTGSPGMLARHYAPKATLRLNAAAPKSGEAYLAFGPDAPADALNLSEAGDLREAAANLFASLRRLDAKADRIAVAPIPEEGLGEAINDRLRRAAS